MDTFSYFSKSHVGKQRTENQDNYCVIDKGTWIFFAVCDGMGGVSGGNIASEIAIDTLVKKIHSHVLPPTISELTEIVQLANRLIFDFGTNNNAFKGLGTTISGLLIDGTGFKIVHVGDSRVYRIRDRECNQLTTDHTWVAELKNSGLMAEDNLASPISHMLSRSLGVGENVEVESVVNDDLAIGDIFILCTDGLHNYLKDSFSVSTVLDSDHSSSPKLLTEKFVKFALDSGGSDNVTLIVNKMMQDKASISKAKDKAIKIVGRDLTRDLELEDTSADFPKFFEAYQAININSHAASNVQRKSFITDTIKYFIFGGFFAVCSALFVWFIRGEVLTSANNSSSSANSSKVKNTIDKKLQASINIDLPLEDDFFQDETFFSISELFEYIRLKNEEVLFVTPEVKKSEISNFADVDLPSRPINWTEEKKRVKELRNFGKQYESLTSQPKDNFKIETIQSSEIGNDKTIKLNEKVILREKIFDLDEKILQLNIHTEKEAKKYSASLMEKISKVDTELAKINVHIDRYSKREYGLKELQKLKLNSSEKSLDMLAARLSSFDQSFEPALRRIKLLRDTQNYYLDLIGKISKSEEVFLKLTFVQQELVSAQKDLTNDLEASLGKIQDEHAACLAGLSWARFLLNVERDRLQRALGFTQGFVSLSSERSEEMYSVMADQRNKLYKDFKQHEELASSDLEFKKAVKENYLNIKNSLG